MDHDSRASYGASLLKPWLNPHANHATPNISWTWKWLNWHQPTRFWPLNVHFHHLCQKHYNRVPWHLTSILSLLEIRCLLEGLPLTIYRPNWKHICTIASIKFIVLKNAIKNCMSTKWSAIKHPALHLVACNGRRRHIKSSAEPEHLLSGIPAAPKLHFFLLLLKQPRPPVSRNGLEIGVRHCLPAVKHALPLQVHEVIARCFVDGNITMVTNHRSNKS